MHGNVCSCCTHHSQAHLCERRDGVGEGTCVDAVAVAGSLSRTEILGGRSASQANASAALTLLDLSGNSLDVLFCTVMKAVVVSCKASCCASPSITKCCGCGSSKPLKLVPMKPAPFFYSMSGVEVGCSFRKICQDPECMTEHRLHSFCIGNSSINPCCKRTPYPKEEDTSEWQEVTKQSYVHTKLLRAHNGALIFQHRHFAGATKMWNYALDQGERGEVDVQRHVEHLHASSIHQYDVKSPHIRMWCWEMCSCMLQNATRSAT